MKPEDRDRAQYWAQRLLGEKLERLAEAIEHGD